MKEEPVKDKDYYRDYVMMIIVFVFLALFILTYLIRASTPEHWLTEYPARISQKLILIVDCIAIFFLDMNDM
jgi:hypothetical protein